MTKNTKIRPIKTEDDAAIKDLVQKTLKKYHLDIPGTAYFDPYLGELTAYYAQIPRAEYWVLIHEDKVIGGVGIAPFNHSQTVAEIQKYYIEDGYQGRGYGSALFQKAKQFAIDNGYTKLYVETTDVLGKANEIYEHYGFDQLARPLAGSEHNAMNTWYIYNLHE